MATPPPGSFGLSMITGKTGALVRTGQALTGDASRYDHAFVVVDGGFVVEAEPGGARLTALGERLGADDDAVFCDEPVQSVLRAAAAGGASPADVSRLEGGLRREICTIARSLQGTPYSYFDYPLLGLLALGVKWNWVRKRVSDDGHMICSQLVDFVFLAVDIDLFPADDRLPMDVTPGDLDLYRVRALEAAAGQCGCRP